MKLTYAQKAKRPPARVESEKYGGCCNTYRLTILRNTKGLGLEEIETMINQAESRTDVIGIRNYAIMRLLWGMQLRRITIAEMDYEDIDLPHKTILVKLFRHANKKEEIIPEKAFHALCAWLKIRGEFPGPLFRNYDRACKGNGRLTLKSIGDIVRNAGGQLRTQGRRNGVKKGVFAGEQLVEHNLYCCTIRSAKVKGIEFNLSLEEYISFHHLPCHYCGNVNCNTYRLSAWSKHRPAYRYNGIDRIDSKMGYTLDNCVPCCGICNKMKLTMTEDEFLAHLSQVLEYTNGGLRLKREAAKTGNGK